MESPAVRRLNRLETKSGFDIKGVILMLVCIFYTIAMFLTAAFISKASASLKSKVSLVIKRYQYWNIEHVTKLDTKPTRARIYKG